MIASFISSIETARRPGGAYRVLYEVHDDVLIVLVVKVGHRHDV